MHSYLGINSGPKRGPREAPRPTQECSCSAGSLIAHRQGWIDDCPPYVIPLSGIIVQASYRRLATDGAREVIPPSGIEDGAH
eukprot:8048445-Pyramimonas_sp.AAC.1